MDTHLSEYKSDFFERLRAEQQAMARNHCDAGDIASFTLMMLRERDTYEYHQRKRGNFKPRAYTAPATPMEFVRTKPAPRRTVTAPSSLTAQLQPNRLRTAKTLFEAAVACDSDKESPSPQELKSPTAEPEVKYATSYAASIVQPPFSTSW